MPSTSSRSCITYEYRGLGHTGAAGTYLSNSVAAISPGNPEYEFNEDYTQIWRKESYETMEDGKPDEDRYVRENVNKKTLEQMAEHFGKIRIGCTSYICTGAYCSGTDSQNGIW